MGRDLPKGWDQLPLSSVAEVNPHKPGKDELPADALVTFVPMPALHADVADIVEPETRTFGEARSHYTAFREDDVLFAKITPCMENGKIAVASDLENGIGFGSSEFHVVRPRPGLDPRFVKYVLRQRSFRREAEAKMTGSVGQKRVPKAYLENVPIPVAPPVEQARIADRVDLILEQLAPTRSRLQRAANVLAAFRRTVYQAACRGELTTGWREMHPASASADELVEEIASDRRKKGVKEIRRGPLHTNLPVLPRGWTWCRVAEIATVQLGGTPSRGKDDYWNGGVPWVSSGEVANCRISETAEKVTKAGLANSSAKLYPKGTVLIAMIGEGKTRGQSAILDIEAATNQNVAGVLVDESRISAEYVWRWALGEYVRTRAEGRGGAQPALNKKKVGELLLPLPRHEEQLEIARLVDRLLVRADEVSSAIRRATDRASAIEDATLRKALRGELVDLEADIAASEGREFQSAGEWFDSIEVNAR